MLSHKTYRSFFLDNKYTKWYFSLIEKGLSRSLEDKDTENHHILPKSIWPEFKNLRKFPWNSVRLTPREHFVAHALLIRMYSRKDKNSWKMSTALTYMCEGTTSSVGYFNSRLYEDARKRHYAMMTVYEGEKKIVIPREDFDSSIHIMPLNKSRKKVTVINQEGRSFGVTPEFYRENKGKHGLRTHSSIVRKNKCSAVFSDGTVKSVLTSDVRFSTGEIKTLDTFNAKGTLPVYHKDDLTTCFRVPTDDPRLLTGELVKQAGMSLLGRKTINDGKVCKKIPAEDVDKYLQQGWRLGMLPRKTTV